MALRSLCTLKSLAAALTLVATLSVASPASAAIIWNWSFGGTEAGTFTTTDGDTSTVAFTIIGFSVTASSRPGLIGAPFAVTFNPQGFHWDGTAPTLFFREQYTNGANFFGVGANRNFMYGFNPTSRLFDPDAYMTLLSGAVTLTPTTPLPLAPPPPPTTVPEPMTLTLLALGCAGMAVRQRSRRQ